MPRDPAWMPEISTTASARPRTMNDMYLGVKTSGTVEGGCRHVRPLRSASLVVADSSNMADVLPVGTWRPCHGQGLPLGEITQDLHVPVILPSDDHTRQTRPTRSRARIRAAGR